MLILYKRLMNMTSILIFCLCFSLTIAACTTYNVKENSSGIILYQNPPISPDTTHTLQRFDYEGKVVLENKCLFFVAKNDGKKSLIIWPTGTLVKDNRIIMSRNNVNSAIALGADVKIDNLPILMSKLEMNKYSACPNPSGLMIHLSMGARVLR